MSDEKYPCLGFNPARGSVKSVRDIAEQLHDTSVYAKEAHETLVSIKDKQDVWTGEAANAFADKLDDLPDYIDDAHTSLNKASKALTTWADDLEQHQRRADDLEEQARQAIADAEDADTKAASANNAANQPIAYDPNDSASASAAKQEAAQKADAAVDANRTADAAWDHVSSIRRQAEQLKETWQSDGKTCAEALQNAGDTAPEKGFFESIGDFVMDHLGAIGDIAGAISAIAGALSFIPFLAPVTGPIAIAAGGVALAAHGGEMIKKGDFSAGAWVGLGADALGVIPGVGAASKGLKAATESMQHVKGLAPAAEAGGKALLQDAGSVAEPAKAFEKLGGKAASAFGGDADLIAKSAQSTVDIGSTGSAVTDRFVDNDTTGAIKDKAGYAGAASAVAKSQGDIPEAASKVNDLGSSMARFARAVG